MFLFDVGERFDKFLRETFKEKTEIRDFLLSHERKRLAIENLCNQIVIAEGRSRLKFSPAHYQKMCEEGARLFAKAAIEAHIQSRWSPAEVARRSDELSRQKEIEACIQEVPSADDDELVDEG